MIWLKFIRVYSSHQLTLYSMDALKSCWSVNSIFAFQPKRQKILNGGKYLKGLFAQRPCCCSGGHVYLYAASPSFPGGGTVRRRRPSRADPLQIMASSDLAKHDHGARGIHRLHNRAGEVALLRDCVCTMPRKCTLCRLSGTVSHHTQ